MKKLRGFSTVWADWADLGNSKTAEQNLKYATFEFSFYMFSWAKNDFILFIFNNRLTHTQLNVCEKEELPCFLFDTNLWFTIVWNVWSQNS